MNVPTWISRVPVSEAGRSVLRELALASGDARECRLPIPELAKRAGVSKRTVLRVLPQLEALALIEREGGQRRVNTVRLEIGDTNAAAEIERCHQMVAGDELDDDLDFDEEDDGTRTKRGDESLPLTDPQRAWRDRMEWCFRTGSGLPYWREAGRFFVEGGERSGLSPKALAAVVQGGG